MAQAQNGSGSAAGMVRGCVVHCPFNIRLVAARAHFGIWKLIPNVDSAQNGTVLNETWAKTAPVVGGWFADGTVSAGELLLDCAADIRFITCQVRVESISRISYKPFSMRWPRCAVNARLRTPIAISVSTESPSSSLHVVSALQRDRDTLRDMVIEQGAALNAFKTERAGTDRRLPSSVKQP